MEKSITPFFPEIIKKTNGGEKWQTRIDYSNPDNWLSASNAGKDVDLIFFHGTTFMKDSADAPDVANIDDVGMRAGARQIVDAQLAVFKEDCNLYAPFYRQVLAAYALTLTDEEASDLLRYSATQDPATALDYYFEHYNNGKPFILAGHSQGSQIVTMILSDYMREHPEYYERMIAAYAIGYSVTEEFLRQNPHLKFAECADDTGVIVSYNTEGPGNKNKHNAVVTEGAISINPLNWKRDETYAPIAENKGSIDFSGKHVEGFADARVDTQRGVVVCESADKTIYSIPPEAAGLFGPESYHRQDYDFYFMNLRENVGTRVAAFTKNK